MKQVTRNFGRLVAVVLLSLACACGGGGSDGDDNENNTEARLQGTANLPPEVNASSAPVINADFKVIDLEKPVATQQVATGVTDGQGKYDVVVKQSKLVAVVVNGEVRVSGLISADPDAGKSNTDNKGFLDISKNFNGVTDIACEAGVTAVNTGAVSASDFKASRIANLEAGALVVTSSSSVNFRDPAAVTAAAALVRSLTQDGAVAPHQQ